MNSISIDPEFREWLPALSDEERQGLESRLKKEGCREPLVVWRDGDKRILADGHNRMEICEANGIAYEVREQAFSSRKDVLSWMIDNQLDKRNITPENRTYLIGKKYNLIKSSRGGDRKREQAVLSSNEQVAEEFKASPRTVNRAAKFATAVDEIKKRVGKEEADSILSRKSKVKQKDVVALAEAAKKKPEEVKDVLAGNKPVASVLGSKKKERPFRPKPEVPKGRQVSQQYLRGLLRDAGACALTSTSNQTDDGAHSLIGRLIKESNTRTVYQSIAILIEEWPEDGAAFLIGTVNSLKSNKGYSNGAGKGSATPVAGKYSGRR